MKKILKLFPVALAVVALTSCSDNELVGAGNSDQFQKDPTKLYVTVEPLIDGESGSATRGGFVYNYEANHLPNGQFFAWCPGDKIKLYDDVNNWRPQIWQYDPAATEACSEYVSSEGFGAFTVNITEDYYGGDIKKVEPQYANAYGVMPEDLSVFINETRTALQFDFSKLSTYAIDREDVTDANFADAKLSKAIIPLWAVADEDLEQMKVKYLSGILKVDIADIIDDEDANTHNFLIVQATDGTNGVKMHPAEVGPVAFVPEGDIETKPIVFTTSTSATPTDVTTLSAWDGTAATVPADVIIVDLGSTSGRTCAAVPLLPLEANASQTVTAYLAKDVDVSGATIDLSGATPLVAAKTWDVTAGKYYRIQDPAIFNVTGVNTLNQLAVAIKKYDDESDRDFKMELADNVNVQGGDDAEGYTLTLLEGLKHNVTLTFAAGKQFNMIGTPSKLVLKTQAGKDLTIDNPATSGIEGFEVDAEAAGKIVLKGTLPKVLNKANDILTIADGQSTTEVTTSGRLIYDAFGKNIKNINILNGCTKITIANGSVNNIWFGDAGDANLFTGELEIYTEGSGFIGNVDYKYVKTNGQTDVSKLEFDSNVNIFFTSKLTMAPSTAAYATTATQLNNVKSAATDGKVIVTAQQLASCVEDYVFAKTIDLGGLENLEWTPITSKALNGNYSVQPGTSTKAVGTASATIQNMKITAAANAKAGLFATLTNNIDNLVLSGFTISGAAASTGVIAGALAAEANGAAITNVAIKNIKITLESQNKMTTASNGPVQRVGGLIGEVITSGVNLKSVDIQSGVALSGNAALGGFVGSAKAPVTFGNFNTTAKKFDLVAKVTTAPALTPTAGLREYDPTYAMVGTYVGYAADNVVIYADAEVKNFLTTAVKSTLESGNAKWGVSEVGGTDYYLTDRKFQEVGFSFYNMTSNAPAVVDKSVTVYGYAQGKTTTAAATIASTTVDTTNETIVLKSSNKKTPAADAANAKTMVVIPYAD